MSLAEAELYIPPRGISVIFLEWIHDKGQVIAEFGVSDYRTEPLLRKHLNDIRHELGTTWRNRLLEDDITYHPKSPKIMLREEAILDHPLLTGKPIKRKPEGEDIGGEISVPTEIKRAVETATDVHEEEIDPSRAADQLTMLSPNVEMQKMDGQDVVKVKEEPFWIQPKEVRQNRILEHKGFEQRLEEVLSPPMYIYEVGVIDVG